MPTTRTSFLIPVYMDCVKFDPKRFQVQSLEVKIRQTELVNDAGQTIDTRFHLWSVRGLSWHSVTGYFNPWLMIENAKKEIKRCQDLERQYPTNATSKEFYRKFPEFADHTTQYKVARQNDGIMVMEQLIRTLETDMSEIPIAELKDSVFTVINCDEPRQPQRDVINVYKKNYTKVAQYERGCDGHYHPEGYRPTVKTVASDEDDEPSSLKPA